MIINDQVELELKSLNASVTISNVVALQAYILETIYGENQYVLVIKDSNSTLESKWNKLAQAVDIEAKIRIGAKVSGGPAPLWSEWKSIRVTELIIKTGTVLTITVVGSNHIYDLKNQCHQYVFKDMSISSMINTIAQDNNLTAEVIGTTDKYTLYQGHLSDWDFIQQELLPRMKATNPFEVFFVYVQSGTISKLIVTSWNVKESGKPKLKFSYAPKGDSEFDPLANAYLSEYTASLAINRSNFGTRGLTFDPLKKQSDPYLVVFDKNDKSVNYPKFGTEKINPISDIPGRIESFCMDNLSLDFSKETRTRTPWNPLGIHRMAIPTALLPKAQVGELAQIDATVSTTSGNPERLFASGQYLIYALIHTINMKQPATTTFLERRGAVTA